MASSIPASAPADLVVAATVARPRERQRTARLAAGGGVFVLVLALVAVAAPWLAPQDPERTSLRVRLLAPTLEAADGRAHALGTDHLGRDVLSRLADAQLAFPFILLAIGIIAVLGPSFPTLILVIGLSGWVSYARVLRAQVLGLRTREFVDAVQALGGSAVRVVLRHIVPNILSSLIVIATLELARAIVLEATLSFLGLGIQPPTPSWGGMIYEGREYLDSAWWISTWPGLVLMATSLVVSRTGDWLRDLLDPTLRGE
ncbi:MAG: peptide ABC transporter permease [Candidatus Rokuibacteriota bacterium]|nr:MAG: peptide ABC transporter permease [Candidatus Rokubacteria bacterium]